MPGLFDNLKNFKEKAEELAGEHSEKIAGGLEKAGDFIDARTDGKYSEKIDTGVDKAQDFVEKLAEKQRADEKHAED
ncbi:antitoxin [Streptomyces sp. NPDC004959]|uniref:antitoxin n=1 Tax=unclassified Streptomyces TaxID=2593676 RepID=UPI000B2BB2FC|nr:antitoxin [Streptomyces sp. NRRL F-5630]